MSKSPARARSLRSRLFGSHLFVMLVALVVLALVVGLIELFGQGHAFGVGRRSDGDPAPVFLGLTAAVIGSAIVSWRVTRRLAAPLEQISSATRELATGKYNVRLQSVGTAELDTLVTDVNQLAHELDTTEQRRLRLLGDVAHELRNPLSTIEGTMEALLDGVMPADDETFARIGREAARLRRLANDLSSLSSAGELGVLVTEPLDLVALVNDVVAQLEPQVLAKELTIEIASAQSSSVVGDRDRLTQVFMNVIGNAIQYTEHGGLTVTFTASTNATTIEVTDSGRGLSEQDQARIFERFYRVDEHFTDGSGVGLAIAKLIVDAHAGKITAHSDGVGQGTTVRIELPS